MRKLGIILAIIVGLIVAVIVIVPLVVNVNQYRGIVQSQLQKALGRPVSFGDMHLSLTPPSVRLDNLQIGESPRFGNGQFATANSVEVALKLLPLIRGNVDIRSLTLDHPQVMLIRNPDGVWNFSTLGESQGGKSGGGGGSFVLAKLEIDGGQVTIADRAAKTSATYNNIDATLSNLAPGKAVSFTAALHLPGAGSETLQMSGTAGPMATAMVDTPFDGELQFNEVSLASLQKLTGAAALSGMDGILTGKVTARNQQGTLGAQGSVKLADGIIHGVKLGYPVDAEFKASDQLQPGRIHIDNASVKLGPTPITLAGDINNGAAPAQLDVRMTLKQASIQEIAHLASAFGVAFNPGMQVSGGISADLHATGPTTAPAMNGTIDASNLHISGDQLKQPVSVDKLALTMTPQQIRSAPFTATTGGTSVGVQFTLSNYTAASPLIDATVRTTNSQLGELLSIAKAYGLSAADGVSGTGQVSLDLHATGPMKDASALQLAGSGKIANASVKLASLTQPVNVRNADLRFTSNSMTMQNLSMGVGQTNASGNVTVQNFSAPRLQFTLHADKVNVAELQQLTATPPPARRASLSLVPTADAQAAQPSIVEKMSGGGNVTIDSVQYDQLLLQNLQATVALDRGIIHMSPVSALVYGGQEHGAITVDMRQTPMAVSIQSKLDQVDANKLLTSVSSVRNTLYGLLAANANTNFRAASSADIARTLNGTVNLDLTKGRLAHVDLLNQLSSIARFTGGSAPAAQPFTDILRLTGGFTVVNGLAQTNNLQALIPGGSLAAQGAINLASNALDMHVTAVLDKVMSQKVGGTQVGGFMNTALANAQGELVIPVLVTGTLDSPRFAPDLQKIAQMKLQQMLPTSGNPGNAVSGILGAVLNGKQGQGQKQQGLGGILGAIAGQQQQQQQQPPPNQQQPNQQQQAQPQQQQNPVGNILNQILQQQQKKKQQQQQPPPK
jgi:uncharacterized protein involved in outer membrane biogenesis